MHDPLHILFGSGIRQVIAVKQILIDTIRDKDVFSSSLFISNNKAPQLHSDAATPAIRPTST